MEEVARSSQKRKEKIDHHSVMWTLASSVPGFVDEMRQNSVLHMDYQSPVEKKGWHGYSLKGRVP